MVSCIPVGGVQLIVEVVGYSCEGRGGTVVKVGGVQLWRWWGTVVKVGGVPL